MQDQRAETKQDLKQTNGTKDTKSYLCTAITEEEIQGLHGGMVDIP